MNKPHSLAAMAAVLLLSASVADAAIFVKYEGLPGDVPGPDGSGDWFVADSFSFGFENEVQGRGALKGGTADINIGIGELQEATISKSIDRASTYLAQFAINGRSIGTVEVCVAEEGRTEAQPVCYLRYKLDRCFVKSWSTSGDADDRPTEEVAFYYNKIAFSYSSSTDGEVSWGRPTGKR